MHINKKNSSDAEIIYNISGNMLECYTHSIPSSSLCFGNNCSIIVVCSTCSGFCCEPCGQSFQYQNQYNKHVASRAHITFVDKVSGFVQPVPVEEVCFFVHLISALLLIIPRLPFMMSNHCRPRATMCSSNSQRKMSITRLICRRGS